MDDAAGLVREWCGECGDISLELLQPGHRPIEQLARKTCADAADRNELPTLIHASQESAESLRTDRPTPSNRVLCGAAFRLGPDVGACAKRGGPVALPRCFHRRCRRRPCEQRGERATAKKPAAKRRSAKRSSGRHSSPPWRRSVAVLVVGDANSWAGAGAWLCASHKSNVGPPDVAEGFPARNKSFTSSLVGGLSSATARGLHVRAWRNPTHSP